MKVVLVVGGDAASRRVIADALMRSGYGVCDALSYDLVPAVPRLDAIVGEPAGGERFGAPVVPITTDVAELVARVRAVTDAPGAKAA